jgi:hypothetical protein
VKKSSAVIVSPMIFIFSEAADLEAIKQKLNSKPVRVDSELQHH